MLNPGQVRAKNEVRRLAARPDRARCAAAAILAAVDPVRGGHRAARQPRAARLARHRAAPARAPGRAAGGLGTGGAQQPGALEGPAAGRQIVVQVLDARGRLVARSLALGAQLLPQDALERAARRRGQAGLETVVVGGRELRMFAAPIADAGTPASGGVVLVASDTSDIAHTTGSLGAAVALSGAGVVLLAAIAAAALTRRGLRPLSRLADAAGEIERTADPSRRLPDPALADEVGQLTGRAQPDAGLVGTGARGRAAISRRRLPRAAHPGDRAARQRRVRRAPRRRRRGSCRPAPRRRAPGAARRLAARRSSAPGPRAAAGASRWPSTSWRARSPPTASRWERSRPCRSPATGRRWRGRWATSSRTGSSTVRRAPR